MVRLRLLSKKWFIAAAAILVVALLLYIFVDSNLRPSVIALSEARVTALAKTAMNDAVADMVRDISYTDLVTVVKDSEQRVTMLQANTIKMNELASKIANDAQRRISDIGKQGIKIPLGSVIGGQILAGVGPNIHVNVIPAGSVSTSFSSEFETSGINQTRHRIFLVLKSYMRIVVPNAGQRIEVTTQVPVAETIIVGVVPDSFVNVRETDELQLVPNNQH